MTGPRRRMDPDERRAQIIASAREVFLQHGFAGTRVRDIAAQAGITEKLVYVRFSSKAEIYQAAVTDPLDRLVEQLVSEVHRVGAQPDQGRHPTFEHFHRVLLAGMLETAPLLTVALFSRPEEGRRYYSELVLPRFTEAIGSVVAEVTGWPADSVELDVMVEGVLGLHFGLALVTIFDEQPLDVDDVAHQLATVFGGGLVPRVPGGVAGIGTTTIPATRKPASVGPGNTTGRLGKQERRADIARAARQVFIENGAAAARTKDIAERAGITEAFMFRIFDGKDELYRVAIEEPTEHLLGRLADEIHDVTTADFDGAATLQAVHERSIAILTRLAPMIIVALFSELDRGREFYREAVAPAVERISKDLWQVRNWDTAQVRPEVLWRALLGVQFGTVVLRGLTKSPIDPADLSRRLTHLIVAGIR